MLEAFLGCLSRYDQMAHFEYHSHEEARGECRVDVGKTLNAADASTYQLNRPKSSNISILMILETGIFSILSGHGNQVFDSSERRARFCEPSSPTSL
jgi:hypothetical protein